MEELLDICDESGRVLYAAPRSQAHAQGLLHQVVHCWVVSRREDGVWIYFQQRAHTKADFPDYYDLAVGGHLGAGEGAREALLREMREEIGILPGPGELEPVGRVREDLRIGDFFDREIGWVYIYDHPQPRFCPGEEVDRMVRVPLAELMRKELEGAERVTAYGPDGAPLEITKEQWCRHPGEFKALILPWLQRKGEC